MELEDVKKIELNTKVLNDFENIMSKKLDEIEELKITELDKGLKIINLVGLCANINSLIVDGDQRIIADKILKNVFKPQKLESITLNNVKIPDSYCLEKFTNLKMISLKDIRVCNIKELFREIPKPEKLEVISISNCDFLNSSIDILERFKNLKYINLEDVKNLKIDNLAIIRNNPNILKINIINNRILINQINNLLNYKCSKNVDLDVFDDQERKVKEVNLKILDDENISELTIPFSKIEELSKVIDFEKFKTINLLVNNEIKNDLYIEILKKYDFDINLILKDFTCLSFEYAENLKEELNIKVLQVRDNDSYKEYKINRYIEMKRETENAVNSISKHVSEIETFLETYRLLGKELEIVEKEKYTNIRHNMCAITQIAEVLQSCLQCVGIKSNIIFGEDLDNSKEHTWNQVKIEDKWYNVDLGLDIENVKKNRAKYCLLGDESFLETHLPKAGKNNYCPEDYDSKLVRVFMKTGLLNKNIFVSYLQIVINKVKSLFEFNHKKDILALPEGSDDNTLNNE